MKSKLWIVNLGFIPQSVNLALLFLRCAVGISMLTLHGWDKLTGYGTVVEHFPDIGVGRHLSLMMALFAEVVCSGLLVVGALSRFAAAVLMINMSVALLMVHHGDLSHSGGGEPAALYLFAYITILLAGAGRYSADGAGGPWAFTAFGLVAGIFTGYPISYHFQPKTHPFTGSLETYLAKITQVLHDDDLATRAICIWAACALVFALLAGVIGRALYRDRRQLVAVDPAAP